MSIANDLEVPANEEDTHRQPVAAADSCRSALVRHQRTKICFGSNSGTAAFNDFVINIKTDDTRGSALRGLPSITPATNHTSNNYGNDDCVDHNKRDRYFSSASKARDPQPTHQVRPKTLH